MGNIDTILFGPMLGELGWSVSRWSGYCRFLKIENFKNIKCIAADYNWRAPLYEFADEFIPLPDWFTDLKLEQDCYEAVLPKSQPGSLTPVEIYTSILNHYKQFYNEETTLTIRTPRGCNLYVQHHCQQMWKYLECSAETSAYVNSLLYNHKGDVITVAARKRERTPERNVPEYVWNDVVDRLSEKNTVVLAGTKDSSALAEKRGRNIINLMHREGTDGLDVLIGVLQKSFMSLTSQSGPTLISLLTGCPSYVLGHEKWRHSIAENWMQTPCMFREVPNNIYGGVTSEMVLGDFGRYKDQLKIAEINLTNGVNYCKTTAVDILNKLVSVGRKQLVKLTDPENLKLGVLNEQ